jgi:hypothetical protein
MALLASLPDTTLYSIASFAVPPTYRSAFLTDCCNSIPKPVSDSLWQMVLVEDYGIIANDASSTRSCQRLKRSLRQRVQEVHTSVLQKTEFAYCYVAELTSQRRKKELLTKSKLLGIFSKFGPVLRLSGTLRSGGVFLVEICRAKGVRETTIFKCVEYLVQPKENMQNTAIVNPNDRTNESPCSRQTALVVAAARGMSTVVALLLDVGADRTIECSGRFRLAYATKSSVSGTKWTALQFAMAMRNAEIQHRTHPRKLKGLDRCIDLLT